MDLRPIWSKSDVASRGSQRHLGDASEVSADALSVDAARLTSGANRATRCRARSSHALSAPSTDSSDASESPLSLILEHETSETSVLTAVLIRSRFAPRLAMAESTALDPSLLATFVRGIGARSDSDPGCSCLRRYGCASWPLAASLSRRRERKSSDWCGGLLRLRLIGQAKELRDGLALARRQAEALPNGDMTLGQSEELIRRLEAMHRARR